VTVAGTFTVVLLWYQCL